MEISSSQPAATAFSGCEAQYGASIFQEARDYLLITARFSVDVLDPSWELGSNRVINTPHKQRLVQDYKKALRREEPANHLRLLCTREDVERMKEFISSQARDDPRQSLWPSFMHWSEINRSRPQLLAGHHRVEALKDFLTTTKSGDPKRWWICEVYDQDRLPIDLMIRLRSNRASITLTDSHGQIWTELLLLQTDQPTLFQGPARQVEKQMTELLRLNGRTSFPVRRLGTLWRNIKWREMITRWCEHPLGRETFGLTVFEWMSSCRIDDFWFAVLEEALQTLEIIHEGCEVNLELADWTRLSDLPAVRTTINVQNFFYPELETNATADVGTLRVKGFLAALSDTKYDQIYDVVQSHRQLRFPPLHRLLRWKASEGKVMVAVMAHVGHWLHSQPFRSSDRSCYKPPLRYDFLPGLQARHGEEAEKQSIELQRQILYHVRDRIEDFRNPTVNHYLDEYPNTHRQTYVERFQHVVWIDVLMLVFEISGPHFQCEAMVPFNEEDPTRLRHQPQSTIPDTMCNILQHNVEVSGNPALYHPAALQSLSALIRPVVLRWAVNRCTEAVMEPASEWPPTTLSSVQHELQRFQALIKPASTYQEKATQVNLDSEIPDDFITQTLTPSPSQQSSQKIHPESSHGNKSWDVMGVGSDQSTIRCMDQSHTSSRPVQSTKRARQIERSSHSAHPSTKQPKKIKHQERISKDAGRSWRNTPAVQLM